MEEIRTDNELSEISQDVSNKLHMIQDYLERRPAPPESRIRFPRGFIRTAANIRRKLPAVLNHVVQQNIAYTIMVTDVFRWLIVRTDISGVARGMIVKEGICALASVVETMTKTILRGIVTTRATYSDRLEKLIELGVIDESIKTNLEWVWEIRNNQHLFLVPHAEFETYGADDYNRALTAYNSLRDNLKERFG